MDIERSGRRQRADAQGLTTVGFERVLACLDADRDRAGEHYERIRDRLVSFFRWRGCSSCDELADRTIDRVARRFEQGAQLRVTDPYLYFHGVALNVLREHWRDPMRQHHDLVASGRLIAAIPAIPAETDDSEKGRESRLECLDSCLEALSPEARQLVVRYHAERGQAGIQARHVMASALNIPINALRIRIWRIRQTLEMCVARCVEQKSSAAK
jgi:DNA-directed RNA polymerase specialized sigma24 family protein